MSRKVTKINGHAVYKTVGIWEIRSLETGKVIAHEPTKADAMIVARRQPRMEEN